MEAKERILTNDLRDKLKKVIQKKIKAITRATGSIRTKRESKFYL